ncbi:2-methylbutanal oxime monooxygenase [Linum perenne]
MYIFLGKKNNNPSNLKLPPGPTPLPIIGNLHQIGALPYRSFHNLSQKYGPVMFVKIGRVATVVISSGDASRQAMKDHDLDTCSRPSSVGPSRLSYNFLDVAFSPYSDYWREMRKLFIFELLSMKRVHMFWYAREEQINNLVEILDGASDRRETANLTKLVFGVIDGIMGTVAYGRYYGQKEFKDGFVKVICETMNMLSGFHAEDFFPTVGKFIDTLTGALAKRERTFQNLDAYFEKVLDQHLDPKREKTEHEDIVDVLIGLMKDQTASFQITRDHLKAILMVVTILYCAQNIFVGGIDTSAVTTIWAMSELIKNPRVMKKAQSEIREIVGPNQKRVEGRDLDKFKYLELIMRETFRKQPPVPLLIPHYCVKHCKIGGYDILPGTQVLVNTYSLGRDPKCWVDPETFYPERFEGSDVDYRGSHFELVPFGAGRRICPGLAMGTTAVKYTLSNLLYHYDFELPGGMKLEDFPLEAVGGITVHNKHDLIVIPKKHDF